ncbi:integrin alpha-2-like [Saccostrea echinata]|uniref:integrin alpha-2-like n=1 Tax=Saccostrea echinata TaxID=191078 RepID=UPI002A8075E8|nr:integrin alpha-2-like [Saccostrea echinata]
MVSRATYFLLLILPVISGFNIGIKGVNILTGEPGSMFGYSLNFATRRNNVWLLVGAPKATDKAQNLITGTLYYCTPPLRNLTDCKQLSSGQLPGVVLGDEFTEQRSEMWLGASVDVGQFAEAVTFCAPRWRRNGPDGNVTAMNGLCYEVPFGVLEGDDSGLINPAILNGLYNSDPSDQFTEYDEAMFNQTIKYGVSASGLSITYNGSEIWIGSPGLNELAGGVIILKSTSYSVKSENTTGAKQGQLYGYAVSVGRFYSDKISYVAMGGPRDGGSGKVLIMDSNYNTKERLIGLEPGSYFGSVLCVIPGKGDATDYLLVGAPMYSDIQTYSNNYQTTEEMGRVYVYVKSQTNESLQVMQILEGSRTIGSRFGFAMANLNDINNDGFNDVVIGAPFESDGQGAVYVYMGYKRGFFLTQTITAASVAPSGKTLSSFGSSFTQHPADFNNDKLSDLAIGASFSDMAFVLFTNPPITMIVDIKTNLTTSSEGGGARIIAQNTTGFTLNVCFDYEGENIPSDVLVTYEITADPAFLKSRISQVERICFKQSDTSCVNKVARNFKVFKAPSELTCTTSPLEVMVRDDWTNMRGLFVPVDFDVEFNVSTSGNTECTVSCPVVNKFDPTNDDPFAKIRKYSYQLAREGCGSDNICASDVQLLVTSPDTLVTGPKSEYVVDVSVSNHGDSSYNTEIFFTFHQNMTLSFIDDERLICSSTAGSLKCSFHKQRFNKGEQFQFKVRFDSSKLLPVIDTFNLKVEVKSDSNDISMQDNTFNKTVRLLTKVVAIYNVAANPDTYITKTDPKNPIIEVNHSVQIVNTGPSDLLDTLTFILEYPQSSQVKPTRIHLNVSSATNYTLIQCRDQVLVPEGETTLTYRAFIIFVDETGNSNSANNFVST